MTIHRVLEQIGLSEREATLYLCCLEYGPLNVSQLANTTKQKRTTVTYTLPRLLSQGYLFIVRRHRRTLYDAQSPKKLLTTFRQQEHLLEQELPTLELLRNKRQSSPTLEVHEGVEAIKRVYDQIYAAINPREELACITNLTDLETYAPHALDGYYAMVQNKKVLKVRELLLENPALRRYLQVRSHKSIQTELRVLPDTHPIHNDIILQCNTLYLFSFGIRSYVTILHDAKIYQTFSSLFEWLWLHGTSVRKPSLKVTKRGK